jgi:hypothetical protein
MLDHFRVPFSVADFLDAGVRFPQLDPVRHFGFKLLQIFAGIFRAIPAKRHSLCRRALGYCAKGVTVETALFRPASVALHFLHGPIETPGNHLEPFLIFPRPDEYAACGTE